MPRVMMAGSRMLQPTTPLASWHRRKRLQSASSAEGAEKKEGCSVGNLCARVQ